MSESIVAFVEARLAEDEASAQSVPPGPWWVDDDLEDRNDIRVAGAEPEVGRAPTVFFGANAKVYGDEEVAPYYFVARFDPARVLREVAAKRRVLAMHMASYLEVEDGTRIPFCGDRSTDPDFNGDRWAACLTARSLAAPYADHPNFRPEWRLP